LPSIKILASDGVTVIFTSLTAMQLNIVENKTKNRTIKFFITDNV
jgi:hypothetical protein